MPTESERNPSSTGSAPRSREAAVPGAAGGAGPHTPAPPQPKTRRCGLRRLLWDGVLPEAMGLAFVAIIFGGFAVTYWIADRSAIRQALFARQAEAKTLAEVLAASLGTVAQTEQPPPDGLLRDLSHSATLKSLRWTSPEGETWLVWPATVAALPALPRPGSIVAQAAVRRPDGKPAGTLRLELFPPPETPHRNALVRDWGIAAGVTLLAFGVAYGQLRRHLRPMQAIERNLRSYAQGLEQELNALALSDSLGAVAGAWNCLIARLSETQQQLQSVAQAAGDHDVLERFESALFRRMVDQLPLGVLRVDENHRVSYANAAATGLLGRASNDLIGRPLSEAVDDDKTVQALLRAQAEGGTSPPVDYTRQDGDQETALRFRVLPLGRRVRGGEVLVAVEDISQLREGQRARDNFLYHVTHELRTPLTNINAYAETLTKPGFDDEQTRKECYNVIVSETRRLSSLVENILSISQLEVGTARLDIGEVDLLRLLRQMVQDNLAAADERRIDLTLVLPPKVPKISGDKQRLSVLLNNLIGNAIKYTPEGGKVQVKLEVKADRIQISVSDTGIGIAPEDQPHVFEKFYRAAHDAVQTVPGTGLGLAIAREVARLHGGDIRLESQLGKGSTFTFELPLPAGERAEVSAS